MKSIKGFLIFICGFVLSFGAAIAWSDGDVGIIVAICYGAAIIATKE